MSKKISAPKQTPGKIWISSYDIGKKNFAFYIEEFDKQELLEYNNVSKTKRYNPNGTTTTEMGNLLKKLCTNGKTILFKNCDLTANCTKGSYLDPETFHNMTDLLDEHMEYWDKCEAFVIEQQMRKNPMALKLGQHCYSYFVINYGRSKHIIEFPSYHKTQVLGCAKIKGKQYKNGNFRWKAINKPDRKKWSVEKATSILAERNEFDVMSTLTSKRKKDDLADVLCQLQAFKYLAYIDKSI